jgi:hypothetical protein
LGEPSREAFEHLEEDLLHGPEGVVDEPGVDAGFLGELARADRRMPDLDQEPFCRVEDRRGGIGSGLTDRTSLTHHVSDPSTSFGARSILLQRAFRLRPRLDHQVERRLRGPAQAPEAGLGQHLAQAPLPGLRTERGPDVL